MKEIVKLVLTLGIPELGKYLRERRARRKERRAERAEYHEMLKRLSNENTEANENAKS